jgi:hypothetical protein
MNYVHFGISFQHRAPEIFGCICTDEGKWVTLEDIVIALQVGEHVSIRQASESELKRAEALVALRTINEEVNRQLYQLLDQCDPASVGGAIIGARDAVASSFVNQGIAVELLDRAPQG